MPHLKKYVNEVRKIQFVFILIQVDALSYLEVKRTKYEMFYAVFLKCILRILTENPLKGNVPHIVA